MDFYIATYKRQYYEDEEWKDSWFGNQKIVVLANSKEEAEWKVKVLLPDIEIRHGEKYRAALVRNPERVNALIFEERIEGGHELRGI